MSNISINYTFSQRIECVSMRIEITQLNLFKDCHISVLLYDINDIFVKSFTYRLEGDEYLAWNNDDQYIINWITAKLQAENCKVIFGD